MKGVFIVLDGAGDGPCSALGGKTPLEAAVTPNLDAIARESKLDYCFTVREGVVPESDNGILNLLGYDPELIGRGTLEAMGLGIKLKNGDLAFRCNFATIDDLENREILDRRAGRTLTTKEARILAEAINKGVKLPFKFEFYSSVQHRGVLVIRGGFSDNISKVDVIKNRLEFSAPLDDEDDSKLSADLVNQFVRKSHEVLDKHPINIERGKKGLFAANVILCRGAGSVPSRFKKLRGKWLGLGYMPLEIGIEKAAGMDFYNFRYPKMKGIDVYATIYSGLKKAMRNAVRVLKRGRKKYDYVFIHIKETDLPGHDNKPLDKVRMLELLDKRFFWYVRKFVGADSGEKIRLVITADHSTPCREKGHSAGPVPVLIYPYEKIKEGQRFTESFGLEGKKWLGRKLLEGTLFRKQG